MPKGKGYTGTMSSKKKLNAADQKKGTTGTIVAERTTETEKKKAFGTKKKK